MGSVTNEFVDASGSERGRILADWTSRLAWQIGRSRGLSPSDCDDLAADAIALAWGALATTDPKTTLRGYLRRVALNCAFARVRSQGGAVAGLQDVAVEADPAARIEAEERRAEVQAVWQAVAGRFSPQHVAVYKRVRLDGEALVCDVTVARVAQEFGLTAANVSMIVTRVEKDLRTTLDELRDTMDRSRG